MNFVTLNLLSSYSQKSVTVVHMASGQGVVTDYKGQKVARYTDSEGKVHAHSAVCTHRGCIVEWNGTEETWDCPCHGSRFTKDGEVIQGPATEPLKEIDISSL